MGWVVGWAISSALATSAVAESMFALTALHAYSVRGRKFCLLSEITRESEFHYPVFDPNNRIIAQVEQSY